MDLSRQLLVILLWLGLGVLKAPVRAKQQRRRLNLNVKLAEDVRLDDLSATVSLPFSNNVSVFIGANQSVYRFGDVLAATGTRWRDDRKSIVSSKKFEGTLLQEYFQQRAPWVAHQVDFKLLSNLCRGPKWRHYAPEEDLVIHYRNGDNKFKADKEVLGCAQEYLTNTSWAKRTRGLKLRLVTIQHYGANEQLGTYFATDESIAEGNAALAALIKDLTELKVHVTVQSSEDPDVDFCTLVQAKHVCLSKGVFATFLISQLQVIGCVDVEKYHVGDPTSTHP